MSIYCITGIDTDIGKTIITGKIAKFLLDKGENVITQKAIQTGCVGLSEDILKHREIMEKEVYGVDRSGFTCPFVFPFPASPHLAGEMCGRQFDEYSLEQATLELDQRFERVLLEGAGGIFVPLRRDLTFLDYVAEPGRRYPLIIVTSPRLGSINHTLLTLDAAIKRNIPIAGIVYNMTQETDPKISADSKTIFSQFLQENNCPDVIIEFPNIKDNPTQNVDFSALFGI